MTSVRIKTLETSFFQGWGGFADGRAEVDRERESPRERQGGAESGPLGGPGSRQGHAGRKTLKAASKSYILLYKPKGYLTTYRDPEGRPTVYALLGDVGKWLHPVGRLDLDTSGLLILTNDNDFAERITNPDHKVPKTYQIKASTVLKRRTDRAVAGGSGVERRADASGGGGAAARRAEAHLPGDDDYGGAQPAGAAHAGGGGEQGIEAGADRRSGRYESASWRSASGGICRRTRCRRCTGGAQGESVPRKSDAG